MPATAAPRTLFVLGGGGALGAYQAGGLLALAEAGVRPDALYGCSAGALNAAFVAADPSPECVAELAEWWVGGRARGVLTPGLGPRLRTLAAALTARSDGLLDARPLRRLVAARVRAEDLTDLPVPVTVTTTCLDCGAARHHREGPVVDLLAASCALPGLFPPVRLPDGHVHVDGGVLCGVPVAQALADAGPRDRVVVLDCGLAATTGRLGCCGTPLGGDGLGDDRLGGDVPGGDPSPASEAAQEEACGLPVARPGRRYRAPVESSKGALDVVLRSFTLARAVANRASLAGALADPRVRVVPHVGDAWVAGLLDELPAGPRDVTHLPALVAAGADATRAWLATGALPGAAPAPRREQVLAAGPLVAAGGAGGPATAARAGAAGEPGTSGDLGVSGEPGVSGDAGVSGEPGEAAALDGPARRERRAGDRRRARRRTTDRPGPRAASRALAALPEPDAGDPVVVAMPTRAGEADLAGPDDPLADDLSG